MLCGGSLYAHGPFWWQYSWPKDGTQRRVPLARASARIVHALEPLAELERSAWIAIFGPARIAQQLGGLRMRRRARAGPRPLRRVRRPSARPRSLEPSARSSSIRHPPPRAKSELRERAAPPRARQAPPTPPTIESDCARFALPLDFTEGDLRHAYKRAVLAVHPDLGGDNDDLVAVNLTRARLLEALDRTKARKSRSYEIGHVVVPRATESVSTRGTPCPTPEHLYACAT